MQICLCRCHQIGSTCLERRSNFHYQRQRRQMLSALNLAHVRADSFLGCSMQNNAGRSSQIRLAITHGVPSPQLSALLALQREEEPESPIVVCEVTGEALMAGLREGRYDAGLALEGTTDVSLNSQRLWCEDMVVAMPLRYPLLDKAALTLDDLLDYPIFRWQAEPCPLLDQQLAVSMPERSRDAQPVTSFEMLALWVAAGYGIGITAQSRITHARAWDICMRPFTDTPYATATHLLRPTKQDSFACERFAHRAQQVTKAAP